MSLFVDASALTAIIVGEPDADSLTERVAQAVRRTVSGIALWETMAAVARIKKTTIEAAQEDVERWVSSFNLEMETIGAPEAELAINAYARYGKGSGHPARLNMGDCFAYACAKANGAALLYKGDDFAQTDLR